MNPDNAALYAALRDGSIHPNEVIEANRPLVLYKLGRFLERHPSYEHLRDDLLAAGYLALVEAVNASAKIPVENPTAYLATAIGRALQHLTTLESHGGLGVSETTIRKKSGEGIPHVGPLPEGFDTPKAEDAPADDLREAIESLCTENERIMINLALDGYSVAEIAERLGCSTASVYRRREAIEKRCVRAGLIRPAA